MSTNAKQIVVAVSGGFDPIHPGHVRHFKEAKALGDKLIVILNNDNWLNKKKKFNFMSEKERKEVLEAIRWIDSVVITNHVKNTEDMSVVSALKQIMPDIYANGGDRKADNIPEYDFCKKHGIKMVFNVGHGGKIQSSSELVDHAIKTAPRKVRIKVQNKKR